MNSFKMLHSVFLVFGLSQDLLGVLSLPSEPKAMVGSLGLKCPSNGGCHPHPEKCELYFCCTDEFMPIQYSCPGKQLFDIRYNGCNWPELTQCQNRTRPGTYPVAPPVEETTQVPYPCPSDITNEYFPDANDCSAFYRCHHGISYHQKCATPLLYNEKTRKCGYKEFVDCGSRPVPPK